MYVWPTLTQEQASPFCSRPWRFISIGGESDFILPCPFSYILILLAAAAS